MAVEQVRQDHVRPPFVRRNNSIMASPANRAAGVFFLATSACFRAPP